MTTQMKEMKEVIKPEHGPAAVPSTGLYTQAEIDQWEGMMRELDAAPKGTREALYQKLANGVKMSAATIRTRWFRWQKEGVPYLKTMPRRRVSFRQTAAWAGRRRQGTMALAGEIVDIQLLDLREKLEEHALPKAPRGYVILTGTLDLTRVDVAGRADAAFLVRVLKDCKNHFRKCLVIRRDRYRYEVWQTEGWTKEEDARRLCLESSVRFLSSADEAERAVLDRRWRAWRRLETEKNIAQGSKKILKWTGANADE